MRVGCVIFKNQRFVFWLDGLAIGIKNPSENLARLYNPDT